MARRTARLALLVASVIASRAALAQQVPDAVTGDVLRVCADPANMPFSNRKGEGFENRIAEIVADELKIPLRYYWLPQGPGFVRNTLQTGLCDLIVGYASGAEVVQHSNPYYRTIYVLVIRKGGELGGVDTLDDLRLRGKRLGVTAATPPIDHLMAHGLMADAKTYALLVDRRYDSPGEAMLDDLVAGRIDAAVLWGPVGGYFAGKAREPLTVVPLVKEQGNPPLSYRLALGLRHGELEWKHQLNAVLRRRQQDITKVLSDYGVPLIDEDGRVMTAPTGAEDASSR